MNGRIKQLLKKLHKGLFVTNFTWYCDKSRHKDTMLIIEASPAGGVFYARATFGALKPQGLSEGSVGINLYLGLTCLFRSIVTSAVVRTMESTGFRIWMQGKRLAAAPLWLDPF